MFWRKATTSPALARALTSSMGAGFHALQAQFGFRIHSAHSVSGGDIAHAFSLETDKGLFFLKEYRGGEGFKMAACEAEGLRALAGAKALRTPQVAGVLQHGQSGLLLLEYLPAQTASRADYEQLGQGLAALHNHRVVHFGWETDNYIGRLPQRNEPGPAWPEFYANHRLLPQYEMALGRGFLSTQDVPDAGLLLQAIRALAPETEPSLLHGDLWAGNFLVAAPGEACLIDPAVYAGDAEVDLAMTRLFGGFPEPFYAAYHELRPKKPGMERRMLLYQLYYLLAHLNLFGAGYAVSVRRLGRELFGL